MVAGDFFVVITAAFRTLYVFVIIEIGSRKILHYNVTAHPTAAWTLQQFREALPGDHPYRFLIHDRDRIFAKEVDPGLTNLGVRVLRTPVRAPKANAVCERVGGSLRRECLDFLLSFHARHLRMTVPLHDHEFIQTYLDASTFSQCAERHVTLGTVQAGGIG